MGDIYSLVRIASERIDFLNADQEKELIEKAKEGDLKASEKLFCANSRYILKAAKGYSQYYDLSLEDVFSAACEGYVKAIEKFDLNKENRLITLADWWIQSSIQDELYRSHAIKIPHNKIVLLRKDNHEELNNYTTVSLLNACGKLASLDEPLGDDDDSGTLYDNLAGSFANPEEELEMSERRKLIETVMKQNLNDREIYVLKMAFGFFDGEQHSLSEIGKLMGCSKQRADQIKKAALVKLRHPKVSYQLKDFVA